MDITKIVTDIINKAKADPELLANLAKDPEKIIESLTGIDIPDGQLDSVVAGVKTQIAKVGISNAMDKLGDLFKN
ncbi:hypothetical protein EHV10_03090 [Lachnoanaerobaculum gingivalis]|uniref:Uncharacterized protein n=1 Tax=Lachnoanaerobaculum gingivalis TaxID=2490855 RepID=A0A3P3R228_9FIRM|nr:hypothetical protein [Lachnoanaerobaculum gingivalis]RRJ27008.1 hypothetical protein EHV10_03090 [Lachnoanaerobaculum gingivalis]